MMTETLAHRIKDIAREILGPDNENHSAFATLYDIGQEVEALQAELDNLRADYAETSHVLESERDGLRALVERVVEGLPDTNYYQYYGDKELRQLLKDCQEALR